MYVYINGNELIPGKLQLTNHNDFRDGAYDLVHACTKSCSIILFNHLYMK
jgi:hypothetical protein